MLLIDDSASETVKGELKIDDMLTKGRSQWLTVITLWQRSIKSNGDCPTIRENKTMIMFFRTRILSMATVEVWVPKDQAEEFMKVTRAELGDRWAGVIYTDDKREALYKIRAPALYTITTLGRPELRGKLITQRPLASDPEPRQELAAVRNAQRERASYEDVDEQVWSRGSAVVQCPPHEPRVWDDYEKVYRCPRCSEEIPSDDVGDDCSDNESDDDDYDPSPDGGNKRRHAESPGSADDDDDL
jgi:hypothetical protein